MVGAVILCFTYAAIVYMPLYLTASVFFRFTNLFNLIKVFFIAFVDEVGKTTVQVLSNFC